MDNLDSFEKDKEQVKGFESLILSPNLGNNEGRILKEHISPGTIRLAVRLENADALIEDLNQALSE